MFAPKTREHSMEAGDMERTFTSIYQNCVWGDNGDPNYKGSSGGGSGVEYNAEYIRFVKEFIAKNEIESVVDIGCGDWRVGEAIFGDSSVEYTGYDVYGDLVDHLNKRHANQKTNFVKLDSSKEKDKIKDADMLICKDVLQHWDDKSVVEFVDWIGRSNKFKYALVTNCRSGHGGSHGHVGGWRGLDAAHPLIAGKGFSTVLRRQSKDTMLFKRRLHIKDATLVCVDCVDVNRAVRAINKTLDLCSFDKVLLLTSLNADYSNHKKINNINSINEYSIFCIKELYKFIDTKHLLLIQHDGHVVDAKKWKDDFYEYDYIGCMCNWMDSEGKGGNGGISWRSRALLEKAAQTIPTEHCHPEDVALSGKIKGIYNGSFASGYRSELEALGFKFANADVQKHFGFEWVNYQGAFAHHKGNIEEAYFKVGIQSFIDKIESKFKMAKSAPSDINQHLDTLRSYAEECEHVTEMGVRGVVSIWALLAAGPKRLVSYDIVDCPVDEAIKLGRAWGVDFEFKKEDVLKADIEPTDMLFIDTLGTYSQLIMELKMHASKVNKYILLHDTSTYGHRDESRYHGASELALSDHGKVGLVPAVQDFLSTSEGKKWSVRAVFEHNNGLTVLGRVNDCA